MKLESLFCSSLEPYIRERAVGFREFLIYILRHTIGPR